MSESVHPNYTKAAWLSGADTILSLLLFIFAGTFSTMLMQATMIGLLIGVIITLLISMGYSWMRWVMLSFSILGVISLIFGLIEVFSMPESVFFTDLYSVRKIVSVIIDVLITVMLFKAPTVQTNKL